MTAVAEAQATSKQTQENGYKNRAVVCQILIDLGDEPIEEACLLPEVLQYYDPGKTPTAGSGSPGQTRNRELLCLIIKNQGIDIPDCAALPVSP